MWGERRGINNSRIHMNDEIIKATEIKVTPAVNGYVTEVRGYDKDKFIRYQTFVSKDLDGVQETIRHHFGL
jgi:hypothetical protein